MAVQWAAIWNTANAPPSPSTSGPMIRMLLASQLMAVRSGSRALMAMLAASVPTCAQVMGVSSNRFSTSSAVLNMAALITSAVSSPSEAQSFMDPFAPCTFLI